MTMTREDAKWDAEQDKRAFYDQSRHDNIQEYCRCNCDDSDHVVFWSGDGWNEPRGIERWCDSPCGGGCDAPEGTRRRCGDCGEWCDADDVTNETCPACGERGEMEVAQ